jgi:Lar family restriction alleviation protein
MTNGEKFKTVNERFEAFDEFCDNHTCGNCPAGNVDCSESECAFNWLDLEYEEKLRPCPFCGGEAKSRKSNGVYYVFCTNCSTKTVDSITPDSAIDAWNRRAK